jgi:hypothetical protein
VVLENGLLAASVGAVVTWCSSTRLVLTQAPALLVMCGGRRTFAVTKERVGFSFVLFALIATVASAQVPSETLKGYAALQTGFAAPGDREVLAFGADFGELVHPTVRLYANFRFADEINAGTKGEWHYTSGAKYLFLTPSKVNPYLLGGIGGLRITETKIDPLTVIEGINKLVIEVGAGFEANIGQKGFFDLGYRRVMVPGTHVPQVKSFTNYGLVAFGIRY